MIELTMLSGAKVAINPILVFAVQESATATVIVSTAGHLVMVSETFAEVQQRMKGWTKA